jgi:ABC-type polysaccharide/polyol phosphate export permease
MTGANLKTRYRGTWSGALWVFLNPMLMFGAQSYAFHFILKINVEKYPLFLLTGLLPWTFISSSVEMSTSSLVAHGRFLKSFPVSPVVIIFSQIVDNFINYVASFIVILVPIALWLDWPVSNLVLMLPGFLSLFIFVISFCYLAAAMNVFFRDTRFVLSFVMQITFYITPIFYPPQLIPEAFLWIKDWNIFYLVIHPFQSVYSEFTWAYYGEALLRSYSVSLLTLLVSTLFWRYKRNEIYFSL